MPRISTRKKELKSKFIWIYYGRIFIRQDTNCPTSAIACHKDLDDLKRAHSKAQQPSYVKLLLLLEHMNSSCTACSKPLRNRKAIECDLCDQWYHHKCTVVTSKDYYRISTIGELWLCVSCRLKVFPLTSLDNSELIGVI